jgi:hypothetical protein
MPPIEVRGARKKDRTTVEGGGTVPGWLKTPSNVGLASKGLTTGDLSVYSGLPAWGGLNANITGTHTRRRFNLSTVLAPGSNAVFNECHIEAAFGPIQISGSNVQFNDCDIIITGSGGSERVSINANPYYGAAGTVTINNCRFTGGTLFINVTGLGANVVDCYGYGQDPDNNGGAQHRDGFTTRADGGTIYLTRCRFDCNQGSTTGAFFTQDTYQGNQASRALNDPIILTDCMFEGSGYCMTLEDCKDLRVTNCRTRSYGAYAYAGVTANSRVVTTTWTGNYNWANTPPDYQGTILNEP